MKKIYSNIFAACTALFVAAACTANTEPAEPADPADGGEYQEIVISAVNTKTIMRDRYTIDWCQGDAVSAFSVNIASGLNCTLHSNNAGQAHETKFEGVIDKGTTDVIALYPFNSAATYSEGVLTTEIPTSQTATVSSFGNGAAVTMASGKLEGRYAALEFHHLCSVIEFSLPDNIKNITSIQVDSKDGIAMTGQISVDCEKEEITSAKETFVKLSGTFPEGNAYCVTIAPGTYTNGFKFTITNKEGHTYYRECTGLTTEKGKIYNLGTLSYDPGEDAASISAATIETTYGYDDTNKNAIVTGSAAKLTLTVDPSVVPSEYSGLISKWTLKNVKLSLNGTPYRSTESVDVTSGTATEIGVVTGLPYIPRTDGNGGILKYSWTADIYYTVNNGKADVEHFLKTYTAENVEAPGPAADKFEIKMNFAGYTTFSIAKGYDGQAKDVTLANSKDNSTVWGVGEKSYLSGISAAVKTQCGDLLKCENEDTKYDGSIVSGTNVTYSKQTWAAHTISCRAEFDGVEPNNQPSKQVHVTGLPYAISHPANDSEKTNGHPWTKYTGNITWNTDFIRMDYHTSEKEPIIQSPYFYIPEQFNVSLSGNITTNASSSLYNLEFKPNGEKDLYLIKDFKEKNPWHGPLNAYMKKGQVRWEIQHHNLANYGIHCDVYSFNVDYRD